MRQIKDKKIIILAVILIVFTIGYFVIINKVSYAFENNIDISKIQNDKLKLIVKIAEKYGEENIELFNEEGLLYITIQNLIDKGYLIPNEDGYIKDFMDNNKILNDKKIRIKKENEKITAEIYS